MGERGSAPSRNEISAKKKKKLRSLQEVGSDCFYRNSMGLTFKEVTASLP